MRLAEVVLLLTMLVSTTSPSVDAYRVAGVCRTAPHEPTVAGALVTQSFGFRGHVGVDYGESSYKVGSPVYSVMDGWVIQMAQDSRTYGRFVMVLNCDGYAALYGHLSETKVEFGQAVRAGELIALSGGNPRDNIDGDGQSTGSHLHFEIRSPNHFNNNLYNVNPVEYLKHRTAHFQLPYCKD